MVLRRTTVSFFGYKYRRNLNALSIFSCIQTLRVHDGAVWALLANEAFTSVFSGGRDQQVFLTDLRNPNNSTLVCNEKAPVLKLCHTVDQQSLWVKSEPLYIQKS